MNNCIYPLSNSGPKLFLFNAIFDLLLFLSMPIYLLISIQSHKMSNYSVKQLLLYADQSESVNGFFYHNINLYYNIHVYHNIHRLLFVYNSYQETEIYLSEKKLYFYLTNNCIHKIVDSTVCINNFIWTYIIQYVLSCCSIKRQYTYTLNVIMIVGSIFLEFAFTIVSAIVVGGTIVSRKLVYSCNQSKVMRLRTGTMQVSTIIIIIIMAWQTDKNPKQFLHFLAHDCSRKLVYYIYDMCLQ